MKTMLNLKIENDLNIKNQKIIFIIGSGRSGTNWIGEILKNNPQIKVTIEIPKIFWKVTEIALNQNKYNKLFPKLIKEYQKQLRLCYPYHYMDKSHPNIWIAEELNKIFDNARFIGIVRNPYATVSSMLQHRGVLEWHKNWERYPIPNKFLGINKEITAYYDTLTLSEKCILRWISHYKEMNRLKTKLGSNLLVINYEDLFVDEVKILTKIKEFLELKTPLYIEELKKESLDKWKKYLSKEQVDNISNMLAKYDIELGKPYKFI